MNKIRVIDLLNKIAKGEEYIPNVRYEGKEYKYSHFDGDYQTKNGFMLLRNLTIQFHLNDEIEIIEEPKKIEKLEMEEEYGCINTPILFETVSKLNEVIDKLNSINNKW